jgi:hypothetical protein
MPLADVLPRIFNLRPGLNAQQRAERRRAATILEGNANPEAHAADASHLSEAAETGLRLLYHERQADFEKAGRTERCSATNLADRHDRGVLAILCDY